MQEDEILDLVDAYDRVIGTKSRIQAHADGHVNFRAVNGFVVNDKGQLWIPRRTPDKLSFPSALDMSVGGHVSSGETYDQAIIREAMEELNLDLSETPYHVVGYFKAGEHGLGCFQKIYEININVAPVYNQEDFTEASWDYPRQILKRIEQGEAAKDDLAILIKLLYL